MKKIKNFINGEEKGYSDNYIDVFDPSKGETIARVIKSDSTDFEKVIESSKKAFLDWSKYTPLKDPEFYSNIKI